MGKQIYLVSPSYIFLWLYGESLFGSQGMKRTREIERGTEGGKEEQGRDTVEGKEKREKKRETDGERERGKDRRKDLMTSYESIYPAGHISSFTPGHSS